MFPWCLIFDVCFLCICNKWPWLYYCIILFIKWVHRLRLIKFHTPLIQTQLTLLYTSKWPFPILPFHLIVSCSCLTQFSQYNIHKGGIPQHHFIFSHHHIHVYHPYINARCSHGLQSSQPFTQTTIISSLLCLNPVINNLFDAHIWLNYMKAQDGLVQVTARAESL